MNISIRAWSWIIGFIAIVLPPGIYTWQAINVSKCLESQNSYVCEASFYTFIISVVLSLILSFIAFAIGYTEFRDIPKPRPKYRVLELASLLLPIIILFSFIVFLVIWIILA